MFNFIKKMDFKEPHEPEPLLPKKTKTKILLELEENPQLKTLKTLGLSDLYREADATVAKFSREIGTLEFTSKKGNNLPTPVFDARGNTYGGSMMNGME